MLEDLNDQHVVVTGGTGALGAAVVKLLVEAGATVHIPAHRADTASSSRAGQDRVKVVGGVDLADEQQVAAFYRSLPPLWGSVQVAGGFAAGAIGDTSLATLRKMMETNAVTSFLCCREAIRSIRTAKGTPGGRIVNVASRPAVIPTAGVTAYAMSKAAVVALTLGLSEELAAERIWVNAVLPSLMDTPANRQAMPYADFSRWPTVDDVAKTILFLMSPMNAVTRGALVPVYGQS